jgi:hypothetical protein
VTRAASAALTCLAAVAACGANESSPGVTVTQATVPRADLATRLRSVPGLRLLFTTTTARDHDYVLALAQPVDHDRPGGPRFDQLMVLRPRQDGAPLVLNLCGYTLSLCAPSEVAEVLGASELLVEHRFYGGSVPQGDVDWRRLTIAQAAADHHAVVQAMRAVYPGAILTTGVSKGGMTALFHRRFYSDDVQGTVAYVAPLFQDRSDPRFPPFLATRGTAACRSKLLTAKRTLLSRRDEIEPALAKHDRSTYRRLTFDRAYEVAVVELDFAMWQYHDAASCDTIPAANAPAAAWVAFLTAVNPPAENSDERLRPMMPWFFQAAWQLGYPRMDDAPLAGLLRYPGLDRPENFAPAGAKASAFDPTAMRDVAAWVSQLGSRLMFIYGENDPMTAAAVELGGAADSVVYFEPEGNHEVSLAGLPALDRDEAMALLGKWVTAGSPGTAVR